MDEILLEEHLINWCHQLNMEWLKLSGGVPSLSLIPLGTLHQNKYYINDDCLTHLEEIITKLYCEDRSTRPLRCALGFMDILNKDLIPILINSKDQPSVLCSTIKLLVGLTVPVECLVCVDTSIQSQTSQHIVHELTQLLYNAKEAFLDPRATRAVIDHLNRLLEKQPLSSDDSDAVNHSLLLIRNILHAPERPPNMTGMGNNEAATTPAQPGSSNSQTPYLGPHSHSHGYTADCSQQNRLLWNLFSQGLDRLLINLLACSQKDEWVVTIVQLIALFYKDQHVENMQKLLGTWINPTTSESSEDDDESNTSPPIGPCDSPQILTSSSDPTSDSSDSAQRKASAVAPSDESSEAIQNETQSETMTSIEKNSAVTNTASTTSPGATTQVVAKSNRNKGHKFSVSSGAQEGDTASMSSNAPSQHSSLSRESRNSVSSGFHSEDSGTQHSSYHAKNADDQKEKSSKRRHGNCQNSDRRNETVIPIMTPVVIKKEIISTCFSSDLPTLQQTEDTSTKRNSKMNHKPGKVSPPEKEQRRKKLSKRSRTLGHIKLKAVQYTPTEEDISQLLKEFTVDFLLNGYNTLVGELHQQLLQHDDLPLDKSHFLWLITYFLRFASQLQLDMEHFKDIFTIDLLCYLTWEAIRETEEFEMNSLRPSIDLKPCLRRLHLGVTAIREYLQALETYSRLGNSSSSKNAANGTSPSYEERICQIRGHLPAISDLRQLFLLQLRHFNPIIQSRRYLRDVITANHVLLLTLERAAQQSTDGHIFDLQQHLEQFCSKTILIRYGTALEDFKTNGPFVNDCILTVLHHIGADLGRADLLCEPVILRSFSKIWEEEFNMCDDWDDLIEYVVQKFLRNFQTGSCDDLGSLGRSASGSSDQVGSPLLTESEAQQTEQATGDDDLFFDAPRTDIESLKGQLMDSGFQKQLDWIQSSLLISCSARLGTYNGKEFRNPIASLSRKMNVSCPIIPWTEVEASALRSDIFLFLLHRLGLLPPGPHAGLYPRIPLEWSTDTIYSVALCFGTVDQQKVDFDLSLVNKVELPIPSSLADMPADGSLQMTWQPYLGPGPSTSLSAVPHHWLHWVEQSGSLFRSAEITSHGHNSSNSISNHSHRPLDSISTTSSLEVHKTDSSDDEEMEDAVSNASMNERDVGNMTEPVSSNESVSMEEVRPDWILMQINKGGGEDTSSSEEMAAIGSEMPRNVDRDL